MISCVGCGGGVPLGMDNGRYVARRFDMQPKKADQLKPIRGQPIQFASRPAAYVDYGGLSGAGLGDVTDSCALGLPSWAVLLGGFAAGALVGYFVDKR